MNKYFYLNFSSCTLKLGTPALKPIYIAKSEQTNYLLRLKKYVVCLQRRNIITSKLL
jgi:hypothetical protein